MEIWKQCDAVCFDVDSTVITGEGLDELSAFLGKGKEVAELTNQAMGGSMTFREALEKRLDLVKPSEEKVEEFVQLNKLHLTPGMSELVKLLQERDVDIYMVSGGFKRLIIPVADKLGIPSTNIFANEFLFNKDGSYSGFDKEQPTSASGGKTKVAQLLKDNKGYQNLVFIGDGVTDLEASPPADLFIGFGGNVVREKVRETAPIFVYSFDELIKALTSSSSTISHLEHQRFFA